MGYFFYLYKKYREMTSIIISLLSILINLFTIYENYKMDKKIHENNKNFNDLLKD